MLSAKMWMGSTYALAFPEVSWQNCTATVLQSCAQIVITSMCVTSKCQRSVCSCASMAITGQCNALPLPAHGSQCSHCAYLDACL